MRGRRIIDRAPLIPALRRAGVVFAAAWLAAACLPASGETADGVTLYVSFDADDGTVTLEWTGGAPDFNVYRSAYPETVVAPGNRLGWTSDWSWYDLSPVGEVLFYEIRPGADLIAPRVTFTSPPASARQVPINTLISIRFSEAIDCSTVTPDNLRLIATFTDIPCTMTCLSNRATLTPVGDLSFSTIYHANVSTAVRDLAGNAMAEPYEWYFTTIAE